LLSQGQNANTDRAAVLTDQRADAEALALRATTSPGELGTLYDGPDAELCAVPRRSRTAQAFVENITASGAISLSRTGHAALYREAVQTCPTVGVTPVAPW